MITPFLFSVTWMLSKQLGAWRKVELLPTPKSPASLYIQVNQDPLDPPHYSPKRFGENKIPWEFPWVTGGYAHVATEKNPFELRFQIFAQEQKNSKAPQVAQMLLRLWDYNYERLKLVHSPLYHGGLVEVYLCYGGRAGGEQLLDEETTPDTVHPGRTIVNKVNTIYIYDLPSFTDPVEMAREVAHEYGHATWWPIGGFNEPEEWADGYLAEKIYLRWLRDAMAKGEITPDDAMGATQAGLDKWVLENVDPLMMKAAQTLPTTALLADKSAAGMNAFIGLATYIEALFPEKVFSRSLQLIGSVEAKDYPSGVLAAVEEPDEITLNVPSKMFGHAIWLPVGKGKVTGGKIMKFDPSGWVQVEVRNAPIVITNKH